MGISPTFIGSLGTLLLMLSVPIIGLILAIIFVSSHKRIAIAHENMAKSQREIANQLTNLSTELKHIKKDKP